MELPKAAERRIQIISCSAIVRKDLTKGTDYHVCEREAKFKTTMWTGTERHVCGYHVVASRRWNGERVRIAGLLRMEVKALIQIERIA